MVRSPDTGSQCAPLLLAEHSAVVPGDPQSSRHDAGATCCCVSIALLPVAGSTGAARVEEMKGKRRNEG